MTPSTFTILFTMLFFLIKVKSLALHNKGDKYDETLDELGE